MTNTDALHPINNATDHPFLNPFLFMKMKMKKKSTAKVTLLAELPMTRYSANISHKYNLLGLIDTGIPLYFSNK